MEGTLQLVNQLCQQSLLYPKSIGVASMLQLGKLIKKTEKPKETMELSDFNLDSMTWSTPVKIDIYVEEHPFAKGAFQTSVQMHMLASNFAQQLN